MMPMPPREMPMRHDAVIATPVTLDAMRHDILLRSEMRGAHAACHAARHSHDEICAMPLRYGTAAVR